MLIIQAVAKKKFNVYKTTAARKRIKGPGAGITDGKNTFLTTKHGSKR